MKISMGLMFKFFFFFFFVIYSIFSLEGGSGSPEVSSLPHNLTNLSLLSPFFVKSFLTSPKPSPIQPTMAVDHHLP